MLKLSRRTVTLAASIGLSAILGVAMPAAPAATADDQDIAQALRAGGLVIVVRHGATFPDQADTDPLNFDNIAAQRNLNDKGKVLAKEFGAALRQAGVDRGACRLQGHHENGGPHRGRSYRISKTRIIAALRPFRKMLGTVPQGGTNTILVTHYPHIIVALGKDWFEVKT